MKGAIVFSSLIIYGVENRTFDPEVDSTSLCQLTNVHVGKNNRIFREVERSCEEVLGGG